MALLHEQLIIGTLKLNPYIKGIRILTTSKNFEERFEGSVSFFFRVLKNGLNSFQSISNRKFFKNLSGNYTLIDGNLYVTGNVTASNLCYTNDVR